MVERLRTGADIETVILPTHCVIFLLALASNESTETSLFYLDI
ncbi:unnamed protein product [Brassica napus]|uniref:(rape) hypothetical protein n=1 Tax=Brassica napus TaxID=3708 RepID=A0A816WYI9_BRANA|nr:unnamed protein product [Brassica napus]